ncbi:hypothetical protein XENOCAPTIV_016618, partial [Xenoophorus captivus]
IYLVSSLRAPGIATEHAQLLPLHGDVRRPGPAIAQHVATETSPAVPAHPAYGGGVLEASLQTVFPHHLPDPVLHLTGHPTGHQQTAFGPASPSVLAEPVPSAPAAPKSAQLPRLMGTQPNMPVKSESALEPCTQTSSLCQVKLDMEQQVEQQRGGGLPQQQQINLNTDFYNVSEHPHLVEASH